MSPSIALRQWVKSRRHPAADLAYRIIHGLRCFSLPVVPGLHRGLYQAYTAARGAASAIARALWWTPLFQSRLEKPAPGLYLYGGMPLVLGPVSIRIGERCRVSGQTTISGRTSGLTAPLLVVGSNCDIGWQTTIAVGRRILIGDNVRIAGRALLAGYPGHPLAAGPRAAGLPDTEDQVADIVLEDDVWLATGVTVSAGVRIGRGTVVAAGSVVTRDLPAGVLAGGAPARVIRHIAD